MESITLLCLGILISAILLYLRNKYASDSVKWKRTKFELKMLWMGTKGNYEDAIWQSHNHVALYKQPQKIVVMTGGHKGIGIGILTKLLECEMTVVLGCRNPKEAQKSVEANIDSELIKNRVFYEVTDTSDLDLVRKFAETISIKYPAINLLINNAGILSAPENRNKEGFISQMSINYLGHFMLSHLLIPQLRAGAKAIGIKSRIINVASNVHEVGTINYDDFHCNKYYRASMAYANSKLAQIMFTYQLEKICRREKWEIQTFAPHPGVVNTDIFQKSVVRHIPGWIRFLFKTVEEGARTIIYAAIAPELEGKGGVYLTNCFIHPPVNKLAHDDAECEKLFNFTREMLKIGNFGKKDENSNEIKN